MAQSSTRGAARLRLLIAEIVADNVKAYDIPTLGERLGLATGTESEAFSSKRMYMSKRLQSLSESDLRRVGQELARDYSSEELNALVGAASPSDGAISDALSRFDKDRVHQRWSDALERRATDPEGAITLARTLLEDVLKWLLTKQGIHYDEKADLPSLYRLAAAGLNLAPDQHNEDVFKRILGSCQSVVESLGTLRNRLSDSHSSGPLRAKPQARHAELAVNLSGAMATFIVATWETHQIK